jgi:hypothetical protein
MLLFLLLALARAAYTMLWRNRLHSTVPPPPGCCNKLAMLFMSLSSMAHLDFLRFSISLGTDVRLSWCRRGPVVEISYFFGHWQRIRGVLGCLGSPISLGSAVSMLERRSNRSAVPDYPIFAADNAVLSTILANGSQLHSNVENRTYS